MQKFYVDDCPEELDVGSWIKMQLPWEEAVEDVFASSKNASTLNFEFDFLGDNVALKDAVDAATLKYGKFGWRTREGDTPSYSGFSLTYNPNLQYQDQDIHQSTLGTKLNSQSEFYNGSTQHHKFLKNSYFDGMSFNEFTPAAKTGYLGELLEDINKNITITRSRLGIVSGKYINPNVSYHCDSEVFELFRLNIPVYGDDSFIFQFDGLKPYCLEVGKAYTWQTQCPHRVMCVRESPINRANLVIGLSPWLTYNKEEKYWFTNEFFGKKHPFDIMIEGHVTDKINFIRSFN